MKVKTKPLTKHEKSMRQIDRLGIIGCLVIAIAPFIGFWMSPL